MTSISFIINPTTRDVNIIWKQREKEFEYIGSNETFLEKNNVGDWLERMRVPTS